MKFFKEYLFIIFVFLFISLLILGCQKRNEEALFFDGLYLKYQEVFGNPETPERTIWTRDIEYRFKELENGNYHISQKVNTKRGKRLNKKIEPTSYPQVGEDLTIDKKGIVLKGGDGFMNFINEFPSYLWLPSDKRKKGAVVIEAIREVEDKTRWEGREVWPAKGMIGDVHYYDVNTGVLVGVESLNGNLKMKLVDTNHETLKTSLFKNIEK